MGDLRRSTSRAWLDLVRLPNLFIAAADILAGFFFAGGMAGEWFVLIRLMLASMCLYAGGVVLNDVVDVEQDRRERPHRPLPSQHVSISSATRLACFLLLLGVAISATVSQQDLWVSLALCLMILAYNLFKQTLLAPPIMGLCRALNLLLGMYGLETLLPLPAVRPMSVMFLYVTSVTLFARREGIGGSRLGLLAGTIGIAFAISGLWGFRWYGYNSRHPEYAWLVGPMIVFAVILGLRAIWRPTGANVQGAVRIFVMGIVALDACVAWVAAGPGAAGAVASLLIPCILLARKLRVT
jgi:4-hydroxybenzoate polyprenyltransferase